jgi:excisionase family DNA binding protein
MDLTPQDLWTLRNILIAAIRDSHEVLATAARRAKTDKAVLAATRPLETPAPVPPARSEQAPRLAYTMKEAARLLSLSRTTLYRLIGEGAVPTVQVGGRRLVRAADLAVLLTNGQSRQ